MVESFPLHWPANKPRTPKSKQERARFSNRETKPNTYGGTYTVNKEVSVAEALKRLLLELDRYKRVPRGSIIVSTNIPVRNDGLPYSNAKTPDDTGVAVYFKLDKEDYCLPCDKWDRVADNIAAVASHVSAMRGIDRWGVGQLHDVFTGFKALPAASENVPEWWNILNCRRDAPAEEIKLAFREQAKKYHPDSPSGNAELFVQVTKAYNFAMQQFAK